MSISGILVPLDGAGIAASVLPTVASLARPIRASVHLTAVVDPQKLEIPTLYYQPNVDSSADSDPSKPDSAPLVAPNAQVSLYPWKENERKIELAIQHIRGFMATNAP